MKRFQEVLMKDFGWKLLSVAIAAIMWFMVINITQPVDTRSYSRPISLKNTEVLTEQELAVGNEEELKNARVTVKVKAQRTALDRLSQNPEWIQATVDLSELAYTLNGDVVALPISVSFQGGVTGYGIVSKTPAVMEVQVETLVTKTFPIEVLLNGEPNKNVYLSKPKLSADSVIVTGPRSAVEQISNIKASVNAEELQQTDTVRAVLAAYDANGYPVKGITTNLREITVSYSLQEPKQVPVQVNITGAPAEGYRIGSITCTPDSVEIIGSEEALQTVSALHPKAIDISGLTASTSYTVVLTDCLPTGVALTKKSNSVVQAVIEILPPESKEVTLDSSAVLLIGQENDKSYTIDSISFVVTGDAEALKALQPETVTATADVSALSEGTHTIPLEIPLPEGISPENDVSVTVTILSETEEPEQE